MRIHSLSRLLLIPIALVAVAMWYFITPHTYSFVYWIAVPLFLLAALYVSYPYIDYWWHTKYPIPLDEELKIWLRKYSPFYNALDAQGKEKYEYRLGLYIEAREFKLVGKEQRDVPEDIKAMIASHAIELSFNKKDFLIGDFDRIFLYKHPFPTPRMQFLHTLETQQEDGVIILSMEHVVSAVVQPEKFYDIAMHAYAEAFVKINQSLDYPVVRRKDIEILEKIGGVHYRKIQSTIGYKEIDPLYVMITLYFNFPQRFKEQLPEHYDQLHRIFGVIWIPQ